MTQACSAPKLGFLTITFGCPTIWRQQGLGDGFLNPILAQSYGPQTREGP